MRRWPKRVPIVSGVILALAAATLLPTSSFIVLPGPVTSLREVVSVSGHDAGNVSVHMVSVLARQARVADLLSAAFNPSVPVISSAALFGGKDEAVFAQENEAAMAQSQSTALYLAYRELGYRASLGGSVPYPVTFEGGEVSGPSAGLAFALEVALRLGLEGPADDLKIAATGTLDSKGNVGGVGFIEEKVRACEESGMDVFLVPQANVAAARGAAREVRVVGVDTFSEAARCLSGGR